MWSIVWTTLRMIMYSSQKYIKSLIQTITDIILVTAFYSNIGNNFLSSLTKNKITAL